MSIVKTATATMKSTEGAAAATELPPLTPEEIIEQLRALQARIPGFVQLPKDRKLERYRRQARINPEFAREAFHAVGVSKTVQNFIGNTPEELYQADEETTRLTAVRAEVRALLQGVDQAILVRRQRIALAATQVYSVSRQLVDRGEHAELLPHVNRMRQLARLNRRRAKTAAEEPQHQQQPQLPPKTA